ncbi:hypothetical protein LMG33810_002715 [Carnimonas sp. LMG 33810]
MPISGKVFSRIGWVVSVKRRRRKRIVVLQGSEHPTLTKERLFSGCCQACGSPWDWAEKPGKRDIRHVQAEVRFRYYMD